MPKTPRSRLRRVILGLGLALAGLLVVLLVATGGFALWLKNADLKPLLEREASEALGRRVTAVGLEMRWGDPLGVELRDLRIANASWGSEPDMIRIGRLSALLDLPSLWRGVLRYERLRIADARVVLERDPAGIGNWKFGAGGDGGLGIVPKDRAQFPTLIDFVGEQALITYRTRGGNVLRIALDQVAVSSPDEATPVRLEASGAYNDVAARLDATTEGFATLRDADTPFGTQFTLTGPDTSIAFDGTMMEPLDFEGVLGQLSVEARSLSDILTAMGMAGKANVPLSVAGAFTRDGEDWALSAAKGALMESDFSGDLALLEGGPGEPDDIALNLSFSTLDVDAIAAGFGKKGATKFTALSLRPVGLDAVNLSARLRTPILQAGRHPFHEVTLDARLAGGKVRVKDLRFAFGGGTVSSAATLEKDGRLALEARLTKADIAAIAALLGAKGDEIGGRLDGAATLRMRGETVGAALKTSAGAIIVTLRDGTVDRGLVEQLSGDLRSLFREQSGRVPVSCLLAVVTIKDGIGVLGPLRLESQEAIVVGGGKIDLVKNMLDLTLKTERDSTNFFALDVPIRVSGPLAHVTAEPMMGDDAGWLDQAGAAVLSGLPPDLRKLAAGNGCAP